MVYGLWLMVNALECRVEGFWLRVAGFDVSE